MREPGKRVGVIFDNLLAALAALAGCLLIFSTSAIGYEVLLRYFWGLPQKWVIEVVEYSILFITLLSTAWLLRRNEHIELDLILKMLKPSIQTIIKIATSILGATVCLIIAWYGIQTTWDLFQKGTYIVSILEPLKGPLVAIIPIGFLLLSIQFMRQVFYYTRSSQRSEEIVEPA